MLTRYWFKTKVGFGLGITAFTRAEADAFLAEAASVTGRNYEVAEVIENIDIRTLDPTHVIPNMGPPNVRGVWFPCLNLRP